MRQNNAVVIESPAGEIISLLGCCEDDCNCTTLMMTRTRRGKTREIAATLPRHVLEYLRDSIDDILEFHDSKDLD